jgi:hypothetical protein
MRANPIETQTPFRNVGVENQKTSTNDEPPVVNFIAGNHLQELPDTIYTQTPLAEHSKDHKIINLCSLKQRFNNVNANGVQ